MGVNNSLLKSIQTIVDKAIEIAPFDKTRQAQIITNNGDGSYTVRLDGILYNNVPSYPKTNVLEVGSIAKIVMPSNQSSQMYIQSSKGGGGGGGDHRELTRVEYEALTPEQKNDGTVYFVTDGDPDYFIMSDSVPIGAIQAFGGETAPEGWLICDGSAVSRETYLDLFKVIGTTYGSGDGSTTFNLPDLRGNVAIGSNETYTLGASGGEKTHTLTVDEMPNHNHSITNFLVNANGAGSPAKAQGGSTLGFAFQRETTTSVGGGQAHSIMQPYIVTNYIIKALQPPTDNVIKNLDPQSLVLDAFYPIGSCYETTNIQFNPNIVWGGTWEKEEITDDEIIDENFYRGTNGELRYKKWKSGILEINIFLHDMSLTNYSSAYSGWYPYYYTLNWNNIAPIDIPSFINTNYSVIHAWTIGGSMASPGTLLNKSVNQVSLYSMCAQSGTLSCQINAELKGLWKEYSTPNTIYRWHRTA